MLTSRLLKYSFYADLFIINWLESAPFLRFGLVQYCLARLSLLIIKLRKKKIVWVLHNIHPHDGIDKRSARIQEILFAQASLVICHSKDAYLYVSKKASGKCFFFHHPVKNVKFSTPLSSGKKQDVLIWGSILPYKGVYEFLANPQIQKSDLRILVVGACKDLKLASQIKTCCSEKIIFENRRADFDELRTMINSSRYILFPYIGDSVSSSGALIDTLILGGTPVGPNVGAFSDLAEMNLCLTYENFSELKQILQSDVVLVKNHVDDFLENNSWEKFIDCLFENMR